MKERNFGKAQSTKTVNHFRAWKSNKVWLFGATALLAIGAVGAQVSADSATTVDGNGVVIAAVPRVQGEEIEAKADKGAGIGQATEDPNGAAKQQAAEEAAKDKGTGRPSEDPNGAAKQQAANEAFNDGYRYGEAGAVLPDLSDKSDAYKKAFSEGFTAGADVRAKKLVAQKAEKEAERLAKKEDSLDRGAADREAQKQRAKDAKAKEEADKETEVTPSTPTEKETTTKPVSTDAKKEARVDLKAAATSDTLPQTGEANTSGLVAMGAVMMAAAAGFVAMKSRKEEN